MGETDGETPRVHPLERLIDPQLGLVFGYGWGTHVREFLQDHPTAELVRDEGDVQEYAVSEPLEIGGVDADVVFQFSLDALITVRLELRVPQLTAEQAGELVGAVQGWFDVDPETPDEALVVFEERPTRGTIDLFERRITLEDLDL